MASRPATPPYTSNTEKSNQTEGSVNDGKSTPEARNGLTGSRWAAQPDESDKRTETG